jgi:hypothetical protein
MTLTLEEREALGRIIALSTISKIGGRDVSDSDMLKIFSDSFKSLLREITLKFYSGDVIFIPYIGELVIDNSNSVRDSSKQASDINFMFTPSTALKQEMGAILKDQDPPSKLELKQKIMNNFKLRLNFADWSQTEDIIKKLAGNSLATDSQYITIDVANLRDILNQYLD